MKVAEPSGQLAISCRTSFSVCSISPAHQRGEPLGPVARGELPERALGDRRRRHLGGQVAESHPRDADVRPDHLEDRLDRLAAVVEPQPGEPDPLLEDLGVVAGGGAGQPAADVAVMGGRRREADQRLVEEHRLEDEDVLEVDAPVEGVVHHEHVAGAERVAPLREQGVHGVRDRAEVERDGHRLGDGLAGRRRRAPPRSPSRRERRSSARCGRSWSPSRRRSTRVRCRRSAG